MENYFERMDCEYQYYLLEDNTIARWWYDDYSPDIDEDGIYFEEMNIEILDEFGNWQTAPGSRLLGECTELEWDDALKRIEAFIRSRNITAMPNESS